MKSLDESFSITIRDNFFQFHTGVGVFSRSRMDPGTRLLAENMVLPENGSVLDLGCGYGALGIIAAKLSPNLQVLLTDRDSVALGLAKLNASLNRLNNVQIRLGNVYDPVQDLKFQTILSNPPLSAGFAIVSKMIREAPLHLTIGGTLQIVVRKGSRMYEDECESTFDGVTIAARGSGYRVFLAQLTKT